MLKRPLACLVAAFAIGLASGRVGAVARMAFATDAPVAADQVSDGALPSPRAASRLAYVPALSHLDDLEACEARVGVMNLGAEPMKAVLILWGAPGACPPQAAGPIKVECTGLVVPGATWYVSRAQMPAGARSGAVYSFTARLLSQIGVELGSDDVVADYLCERLFFDVAGDVEEQSRFQRAFHTGGVFADVPLDRAYGPPIAVEVERACDSVAPFGDPTLIGTSTYAGAGGRDLGRPDADGTFRYAVPRVRVALGTARTTVMVQNAGLECAAVTVAYVDADRCRAPAACATATLAPGEQRSIDVSACGSGQSMDGVAWVEGDQPLAVAVDVREQATLATYAAPAVREPPDATGTAAGTAYTVGYAPSVYRAFAGWRTRIHVQNGSLDTDADVVVAFLDRGGDAIATRTQRICPRGGHTFDLAQVADLPGNWIGAARIESRAWWSPGDLRAVPELFGVVESVRMPDGATVSESLAFALAPAPGVPADDSRASALAAGPGVLAVPQMVRNSVPPSTELALMNTVSTPGYTDFALYLYDQNGLLDYICQKLHERQAEYIALDSWGFIAPGFKGSAVISATAWRHEVFGATGDYLYNSVGLAAVAVGRPAFSAGGIGNPPREDRDLPGDASTGQSAVAFDPDPVLFASADPSRLPLCPGQATPRPRTPAPTETAAPTRTPRPTLAPTDGPSPTPRPTIPAPPALGVPPARPVHVPLLHRNGRLADCRAHLSIQSLADEPTKAVVLIWGAPDACPPRCAGPLAVECTGLIPPGGTWTITPDRLPEGATSAVVFSFTARRAAEVGFPGAPDAVVADVLCAKLAADVRGACVPYSVFKQAYHDAGVFDGLPLAQAYGAPLAVDVQRTCPGDVTPGLATTASYGGTTDVGAFDTVDGGFAYQVPLIFGGRMGFDTRLAVQNAGTECAAVEILLKAQDDCMRFNVCEVATLAPGESIQVDAANCTAPDFQGSAIIRATQPLAVAVDIFGRDTRMTYTAAPELSGAAGAVGDKLAAASGARVLYAPLTYSAYQGWDTVIQVQNLERRVNAKVKVYFLDPGGDIITTLVDWVCPRGSQTFFLPVTANLPGTWAGSVRVESQPWWTEDSDGVAIVPNISAVATLVQYNDIQRTAPVQAAAYELVAEPDAFVWPDGAGRGGLESGVGLVALPAVGYAGGDAPGTRTEIAVSNLVSAAGYTDYGLILSDANGLVDVLCMRIHDGQTDYIDLDRFGYLGAPFAGGAVVSAGFWQHEVRDGGAFIRNLVGLGAVAVRRTGARLGADVPGDELAVSAGIPLAAGAGPRAVLGAARCSPAVGGGDTPERRRPDAPLAHLPLLTTGPDGAGARCRAAVTVQSLASEPTKAVLVTFAVETDCGDGCGGPTAVICTGLLAPGGSWRIAADAIPPGAASGVVFSFSARTTDDVGVPLPTPVVIADALCDHVRANVAGDCAAYADFYTSFALTRGARGSVAGIPWTEVAGAPIAVEVHRTCGDPSTGDERVTAAYLGADGPALGVPEGARAGAPFEYGLPSLHAGAGGLASRVVVQNAGAACIDVELVAAAADACGTLRPCAAFSLAPGHSRGVDVAACGIGASDPNAFGWVRATGPAAVVVETAAADAAGRRVGLMDYAARARHVVSLGPLPAAQPGGTRVAFAPLTYSEHQGWDHVIHVQNLAADRPAKVKVTLFDRSGDILGTRIERICPSGARAFTFPVLAGLPGNWVGTARVESLAERAPDGVWWTLPPPVQAVVELAKWEGPARASRLETIAYEALIEREALDWPVGAGAAPVPSGAAVVAVPSVARPAAAGGVTTELAVANLVAEPGLTEGVIALYDANAHVGTLCFTLNDRQVEYFDLATYPRVAAGFTGGLVISATRWTHVHAVDGRPVRRVVGLGAVAVQRSGGSLGGDVAGDEASAVRGVPIIPADPNGAWWSRVPVPCRPAARTVTPPAPVATPSPLPPGTEPVRPRGPVFLPALLLRWAQDTPTPVGSAPATPTPGGPAPAAAGHEVPVPATPLTAAPATSGRQAPVGAAPRRARP